MFVIVVCVRGVWFFVIPPCLYSSLHAKGCFEMWTASAPMSIRDTCVVARASSTSQDPTSNFRVGGGGKADPERHVKQIMVGGLMRDKCESKNKIKYRPFGSATVAVWARPTWISLLFLYFLDTERSPKIQGVQTYKKYRAKNTSGPEIFF